MDKWLEQWMNEVMNACEEKEDLSMSLFEIVVRAMADCRAPPWSEYPRRK